MRVLVDECCPFLILRVTMVDVFSNKFPVSLSLEPPEKYLGGDASEPTCFTLSDGGDAEVLVDDWRV